MGEQFGKNLTGAAGVYFVAGELSRRGYVALPTIRNLKAYDLLVMNPVTQKSIPLQVKSINQVRKNPTDDMYIIISEADPKNLDKELENIVDATHVFVYFPKNSGYRYFIVRPDDLRAAVKTAWKDYIDTSKHRKTIEELESVTHPVGPWIKHLVPFENRWDLIEKLIQ